MRVLNSCTVTAQADATTRQRIRRLRRLDPAGAPRAHRLQRRCESRRVHNCRLDLPQRGQGRIAEHVLGMSRTLDSPHDTPALRSRAFIKVQDGCDHRCTYCIVWQARGVSSSVPARTVHDRVRAAIDAGHGEIVLCGVDLGSYGRDIGTTSAALLESLLDVCGDNARIRLSSVNANDVTAALIAPQRALTTVRALAHAAAERQRQRAARDASRVSTRAVPASRARAARGESIHRIHHGHHGWLSRRDRGRPQRHPVARR